MVQDVNFLAFNYDLSPLDAIIFLHCRWEAGEERKRKKKEIIFSLKLSAPTPCLSRHQTSSPSEAGYGVQLIVRAEASASNKQS
jgi:hypothetical protein